MLHPCQAEHCHDRYVESWKRHQSLWKTEKASVLDKFKVKRPSNASFEEKLAKYNKLAGEIWDQVQRHCGRAPCVEAVFCLATDNLLHCLILDAWTSSLGICITGLVLSNICAAGLQSNDFDLEFVRIGCRGLAAAVRDEALGWVRALREVMGELDAQSMQVMLLRAFNAPMRSSVQWDMVLAINLW